MTMREHYQLAQTLSERADSMMDKEIPDTEIVVVASCAQVHATLALVGAIMLIEDRTMDTMAFRDEVAE